MNREHPSYNQNTVAVHSGRRSDSAGVVNAIETSSAFRYVDQNIQYYPRYFNTPNQQIITEKICALEHAEDGVVFSSGMAAISTTLLALATTGDHIVFQEALYGGTHSLIVHEFENAGIEYSFVKSDVDSMIAAIQPNTKLVYVETPANPLLEIIDLGKLATGVDGDILTVCDNTFASPINQNPIQIGTDVVIHSGTKYLGGHSDLSFGAVVGRHDVVGKIKDKAVRFGGNLNALACYLIERSIKTLAIRVERQNDNALQLARFLVDHPCIQQVFYPGLDDHPNHLVAREQMAGFGGMLSFRLAASIVCRNFLMSLKLIAPAMSLGAVETTVTVPAMTSHQPLTQEQRTRLGIDDQLIRMSVGIEEADDLIRDVDQALSKCGNLDPSHDLPRMNV